MEDKNGVIYDVSPTLNTERYKVDLRSRSDGDTVETIYSGTSYEKAWEKRNAWFKENLPEWNDEQDVTDLIDGSSGVFAYVYTLGRRTEILGVGKKKRNPMT